MKNKKGIMFSTLKVLIIILILLVLFLILNSLGVINVSQIFGGGDLASSFSSGSGGGS